MVTRHLILKYIDKINCIILCSSFLTLSFTVMAFTEQMTEFYLFGG
jgi:hypothetical protein